MKKELLKTEFQGLIFGEFAKISKGYFGILMFMLFTTTLSFGQVTGDFRSGGTPVDLNVLANWQTWNGSSWVTATVVPNGNVVSGNTITIQSGHTWNNTTSTVTIPLGATLLHQGTTGSISTAANKVINLNGTYICNVTSGTSTVLAGMSNNTGSTFIYRGSNSLNPSTSFSGQTFYNLSFESTSGSYSNSGSGANPLTINGSLTVGSGVSLNLSGLSATNSIAGDVSISGSFTPFPFTLASGKTLTVNSSGSLVVNSGVTLTINGTLQTAAALTSNSGTIAVNGTFQINQGGYASGNWTYGANSTLIYNNTSGTYGPIDSGHTYWPATNGPTNVSVQGAGGINLGVSRTVSGIFQTSATVALSSSATLTTNGTCQINSGGYFANAPIYGSSSSLIYNSGGTYGRANEWSATSGAGYPYNVSIKNGTTLDLSNGGSANRAMAGSLILGNATQAGSLTMGAMTNKLTIGGDLIIGATGGPATSTLTLSSAIGGDLEVNGNWTRNTNGSFVSNSRAVYFLGTGTSTITTASTESFDYLFVNKTSGTVSLANDIQINNNLTLNAVLATSTFKVNVGSAASVTRNSGHINGNVQMPFSSIALSQTFHIGDGTNYVPIVLTFSSITGSGTVLGSQTSGVHPNIGTSVINATKFVNRYYSLTPSGLTFGTYNAVFNFVGTDVQGSGNTANFIVGKFNPTTWTYPTVGTKTSTSTQITGVSSFSDFVIGECATPTIATTNPAAVCSPNTVDLTSSAITTGSTFGLTFTYFTDAGATITYLTPATAVGGTYYIKGTNAGGCSAISGPVLVTVNPIPSSPTISVVGETTFCAGESVTLTASCTTGSVKWSDNSTASTLVATISGLYSAICVANNCPSASSSATVVTVNPIPSSPTILVVGETTFCSGGSVNLTATCTTGSVKWSDNSTASTLVATISGLYSAICVANSCPSASSTATVVTVNPTPAAPTILVVGETTFCSGGSVNLTASCTSGSVKWSDNSTASTLSATISGSYSAICVANSCPSASSTATVVTVNPIPSSPTISVVGETTFCSGGSVNLTATCTTGSVKWSDNSTASTLVATISGLYSAICVANNCPSASSTATVVTVNPIPSSPTISADGATTFCSGGSVNLTASCTSGSVKWSDNSTASTLSATISGLYSAICVANSCPSASSTATVVTVNPIPSSPTISVVGETTFCAGESVTLTASCTTGSVKWSDNSTASTLVATISGLYSAICVANSCPSASSTATVVTVNPIPSSPTISVVGETTFCSGGSVNLTATCTTGSVKWSDNSTASTLSATISGLYSAICVANSCQSLSSSATVVTVNPIPSSPTISADGATTFCAGGSVTLTATCTTGSVKWSDNSTASTLSATISGLYSAICVANSCPSASSTATVVTVNPTPAAPTILVVGETTFCSGGSVNLTATCTTGSVKWSDNSTASTLSATISGSYSAICVANSCQSASSSATVVTVNPTPAAPTILVVGETTFCSGGSVNLTATCTTGSVKWSDNSTASTLTATISGSYSAICVANSCQSASSSVTVVTVNPIPSSPTILVVGETTFCSGGSVTLTATCSTGSVKWSDNSTASTLVATISGLYSAICVANSCQSASSSATIITVNPIPSSPTISADGATTFCSGGSVNLTATCTTGSVKWSDNSTASTLSATISGSYSAICVANSCPSASSTATVVTVNPIPSSPTISVVGETTFCSGGSVNLTASCTTGSVKWSDNSTASTLVATISGLYSAICVANSCESLSSSATVVTVNPIPSSPTISADGATTFCSGGSVNLTATCSTGSIKWSDNSTASTLTATISGSYSAICVANSCQSLSSSATVVTVNPIPSSPTISANPSTISPTQSSTLTATGCTGGVINWSYQNSTDNPLQVFPVTTTIYTATCSRNGCTSAASAGATVTVNVTPCQAIVNLASTADDYSSGTQLKQAASSNGKITATNKITGTATVYYQAKSIELRAGFKADKGVVFKAQTGGCN